MKVQLALDRVTKEQCFNFLLATEPYIDWIEIGTGVIKEYGMELIREIRKKYPDKILVADMKTCDAGKHEAYQAFQAGADITTVMAFSDNKTILETLAAASDCGKRVMVDLLGVKNPERVRELQKLGVDLVSLHYGKDMQLQKEMEMELFKLVEGISGIEVAIAGGIDINSISPWLIKGVDIIIIGSAITRANDPSKAAKAIRKVVNLHEINH